jgi:alpha-amylase
MKNVKSLILFSTAFAVAGISCVAVNAAATYADQIDVSLEQQENTGGDKIRFISTMTPVTDLNSITKIYLNFTLSKAGEATKNASLTTTSVYDEVLGTNGKNKSSNTYYAVHTLTDLQDFKGWTLGTTFEYVYADSTVETTNTVYYDIPVKYTYTSGSGSFEESSSIADCFTADSITNGNIFHAWNWHMDVIKENLGNLKNAGYTTVQTSPMQPQKDYWSGGDTAKAGWWKLYQPLGFCIAPDTCQNAIGTKTNLAKLVTAAHNKGIKVIVDVVANHLAGDATSLLSGVAGYEPAIYGTNGTLSGGALLHSETGSSATDSSHTTNGNIGLPDLNTHSEVVQGRVLSLLKEYIDLGVDGFRFDAIKHIETDNPSEPCGSSSFMPNVVGQAKTYAKNKDQELYCYGEVLNGCGSGRSYDWYLPYMDVIANKCGNELRKNFNSGTAAASSSYNPTGYLSGEHCIVWAESHDTYANDEHASPDTSIYNINKTYAIMGSRNGAKALYLARPTDTTGTSAWTSCQTKLGAKGSDAYKLKEDVAAVNKFRNYWGTEAEYLSNSSNFAMVVRYNSAESGMVLVNAGTGTSVSNVEVPDKMKNGTYTDLVSGNTFTVANGKISGTMDSSCIAVLYSESGTGTVSIEDDIVDLFYTATETATYTIKNAVSATLTVDGETYSITSGATLTFGNYMDVSDKLTVTIKAKDNVETTKQFVYRRIPAPTIYTVTLTKPEGWANTIYAYMHGDVDKNAAWPGVLMSSEGDTYSATFTSFDDYEYIIFSDGTYQSEDLELDHTNASYYADTVSTSHFNNSVGWSTFKAYIWNDSASTEAAAWPGTAISKDSTGLYAVTYNSAYDHIIFNNGSAQTADLPFNAYISKNDYNGTAATIYYNIVKNSCASHSYDADVVTTAPTCENAGV